MRLLDLRVHLLVPLFAALLPGLLVAQPPSVEAVETDEEESTVPTPEQRPENPELRKAIRNFEARRFDEALRNLEAAREQDADLPPARIILAQLFLGRNRLDTALKVLERSARESQDHPELYLTFGEIALRQGRLTDAQVHFEKASRLAASKASEGISSAVTFGTRAALGRASVAERRGDWEQAHAFLSAASKLDASNNLLSRRLARALFMTGQEEQSEQTLRDAGEEEPFVAVALATFHDRRGEAEEAERWFEKAVEVGAGDPVIHETFAQWLLARGRPADARPQAKLAAKLAPPERRLSVLALQGRIARAMNDFAAAEFHLQEAHLASPGNFAITNELILSLIEQAEPEKRRRAVELARLNGQAYPNSTEAKATLAWTLFRIGQGERAEAIFRDLAQNARLTGEIAYRFARLLAERNQPEQATEVLRRTLEAPGFFPQRAEAQAWLDSLEGSREKSKKSKERQ